MRKIFWGIMVSGLLTRSVFGTENSAVVQTKIRQILAPLGSDVSLSVLSAEGKEVISLASDKARAPASVIKLFSTGCALRTLGPSFQFETLVGTTGKIVGDTLKGDLVFKGAGDPRFVVEELREVLDRLQTLYGLKRIEGDLVLDLSYLGKEELSFSNDFEGDDNRAFNAVMTAIPFNFNSFGAAAASFDGKTFSALLPRGLDAVELHNQVKIGGSTNLSVEQSNRKRIEVQGTIVSTDEGRIFYRSVENPLDVLAKQIGFIWKQRGGEWKTKSPPSFRAELKPISFKTLLTWRSPPLSKILIDINKLSTNFGAEMVALKAASTLTKKTPVTLDDSRRFLEACWKEADLDPKNFKIENASGLSRATAVRTKDLATFLNFMAHDWRYPEYASSLSILGEDGTARKRLRDYAGRGRVKTGSIQGVRSIAGYLLPNSGNELAFVLIYQGTKTELAVSLEDQMMKILLENL